MKKAKFKTSEIIPNKMKIPYGNFQCLKNQRFFKQMKKVVILVCFLLILASLASALPPPPPPPPAIGTSAPPPNTTSTTNTTTTPSESTASNQQINSILNRLDNLENRLDLKIQIPQPSSPIGYFIFLFILNLLIIAAVVYLFLKDKIKKTTQIPESIKTYVKNNLQGGYQESQIRQQLAGQGWSAQQINQIFKEI